MGREECYHDGSGLWTHCERKDSCTHLKCASVATVSRVWTVSLASPLSSSPSVLAAFLHTPSDPVAWAIHQLTKGKNKPWIMVLVFFFACRLFLFLSTMVSWQVFSTWRKLVFVISVHPLHIPAFPLLRSLYLFPKVSLLATDTQHTCAHISANFPLNLFHTPC